MPISKAVNMVTANDEKRLRSRAWWDNPANPRMTARYLERFLHYGLTRDELQSDRLIIGATSSLRSCLSS